MSFKNEIFIDTCVFYALLSGNDQLTKICNEILNELINKYNFKFFTSLWVKRETLTKLKRIGISYCTKLLELINELECEVIDIDKNIDEEAMQMFWSYSDKKWGITDCTSIVLLRKKNLFYVFSADHHFSEAGLFPLIEFDKDSRMPKKSYNILENIIY